MKKKMSKPLAVILAAAMSLGLLAGCGGSGDSVSRSEERRVGKECAI